MDFNSTQDFNIENANNGVNFAAAWFIDCKTRLTTM
jgi:hypothetical protein